MNGYLHFSIGLPGRSHSPSIPVHQLLAYQKYGALALSGMAVVRHRDSNPKNNSRTNVTIGTRSEDYYDIPKEVRAARAEKGAAVLRKLTDEQVTELRELREAGATYTELMAKYGISKSTVSYIVNGKTYRL